MTGWDDEADSAVSSTGRPQLAPKLVMAREQDTLPDGRRLTLYRLDSAPAMDATSRPAAPVAASHDAGPAMGQRRHDPLSDTWVTFADHRQGRTFLPSRQDCPLCPTRPGGPATEIPRSAFEIAVFDNRFPALAPGPAAEPTPHGPYATAPARGRCEVVVYTDEHDSTLGRLGAERVRLLVDVWADRSTTLGAEPEVHYVMPFENRGEVVGVTLHHPHGQIYAYPDIPPRPAAKLAAARRYHDRTQRCVLCDVAAYEAADGARVVAESDRVVAFVPFAARFPYEVQIATKGHCGDLAGASPADRDDLAGVLHEVLMAYDALFGFSLPYVLAVQQRPTGPGAWDDIAHLHLELTPPHRSADRLKYLAGSELAAGAFLGDVLPEDAAAALRKALP